MTATPTATMTSTAVDCAHRIAEAFVHYNTEFRNITRRAPLRFDSRDAKGGQRDAVERIELYDTMVNQTIAQLRENLGDRALDHPLARRLIADVGLHRDRAAARPVGADHGRRALGGVGGQVGAEHGAAGFGEEQGGGAAVADAVGGGAGAGDDGGAAGEGAAGPRLVECHWSILRWAVFERCWFRGWEWGRELSARLGPRLEAAWISVFGSVCERCRLPGFREG